MTNPTEALDAIEQALRALPHQGDCCIRFEPACDCLKEGIKPALATLRQQVAELVAFREAYEWRPIETAPRDGSIVLLYDPKRTGFLSRVARPITGYWQQNVKDTRWETVGGHQGIYPTHWQPLPTPPAADGGQGA